MHMGTDHVEQPLLYNDLEAQTSLPLTLISTAPFVPSLLLEVLVKSKSVHVEDRSLIAVVTSKPRELFEASGIWSGPLGI
jgi:hypothetical protein